MQETAVHGGVLHCNENPIYIFPEKEFRSYGTQLCTVCGWSPTFDDELGGKVDSVGPVAGQAGVGAAVGRTQAVEQDVAAERHVLNRK